LDYKEWVEDGLAREIARIDLPLSTYSRLRWQITIGPTAMIKFFKARGALLTGMSAAASSEKGWTRGGKRSCQP